MGKRVAVTRGSTNDEVITADAIAGTRYDRCPETFFSAITLAATVLFWL